VLPLVQKEANKGKGFILDVEEKKVELKPTLKALLPIVSQPHSCALYCPNLEIKVNIIKETLFTFLMRKLRNEVLYDMFPIDAWYLLFGRPLKLSHKSIHQEKANFYSRTITGNPLNPP